PHVGVGHIRVKIMKSRPQVYVVEHLRQKLIPSLMIGSSGLASQHVGTQRGRRIQRVDGLGQGRNGKRYNKGARSRAGSVVGACRGLGRDVILLGPTFAQVYNAQGSRMLTLLHRSSRRLPMRTSSARFVASPRYFLFPCSYFSGSLSWT